MSEKQTILGRISQLAKANVNALLDRAEDPQKMLDQMVRDYTNSIAEAQDAVAVTVGNLRLAQADYNEDVEAAKQWGQKALAASQKADSLRAEGKEAEAEKILAGEAALRPGLRAAGRVILRGGGGGGGARRFGGGALLRIERLRCEGEKARAEQGEFAHHMGAPFSGGWLRV